MTSLCFCSAEAAHFGVKFSRLFARSQYQRSSTEASRLPYCCYAKRHLNDMASAAEQLNSVPRSLSTTEPTASRLTGVRTRISHACDRCRFMRTKCSGASPCSKCAKDGVLCAYNDRKREKNKKYVISYAWPRRGSTLNHVIGR